MQNLAKLTYSLFLSSCFVALSSLALLLASLYHSEFNLSFSQMLGGAFLANMLMGIVMGAIANTITTDKLSKNIFQSTWNDLSRI
jgi:hypothetical protein